MFVCCWYCFCQGVSDDWLVNGNQADINCEGPACLLPMKTIEVHELNFYLNICTYWTTKSNRRDRQMFCSKIDVQSHRDKLPRIPLCVYSYRSLCSRSPSPCNVTNSTRRLASLAWRSYLSLYSCCRQHNVRTNLTISIVNVCSACSWEDISLIW